MPTPDPHCDSSDTVELLRRAGGGDRTVLDDLFAKHRERLGRMAHPGLFPVLGGCVDGSDVIREVYLEAYRRFPEYLRSRPMPFFLWLRCLAGQALLGLRHRHQDSMARDSRREVCARDEALPRATSEALAAQLLGRAFLPSQAPGNAELRARVQDAMNALDDREREILSLRHFEHLSNAEAAIVLRIQEAAASKRYIRALIRLRGILTGMKIALGFSGKRL